MATIIKHNKKSSRIVCAGDIGSIRKKSHNNSMLVSINDVDGVRHTVEFGEAEMALLIETYRYPHASDRVTGSAR